MVPLSCWQSTSCRSRMPAVGSGRWGSQIARPPWELLMFNSSARLLCVVCRTKWWWYGINHRHLSCLLPPTTVRSYKTLSYHACHGLDTFLDKATYETQIVCMQLPRHVAPVGLQPPYSVIAMFYKSKSCKHTLNTVWTYDLLQLMICLFGFGGIFTTSG